MSISTAASDFFDCATLGLIEPCWLQYCPISFVLQLEGHPFITVNLPDLSSFRPILWVTFWGHDLGHRSQILNSSTYWTGWPPRRVSPYLSILSQREGHILRVYALLNSQSVVHQDRMRVTTASNLRIWIGTLQRLLFNK